MTSEEMFEQWFKPYLAANYLVECNFRRDDLPPSIARQCATAAFLAGMEAGAQREREECSKIKLGKPRELARCGTGALYAEQQYNYERGRKEGAAEIRYAIRKRGGDE